MHNMSPLTQFGCLEPFIFSDIVHINIGQQACKFGHFHRFTSNNEYVLVDVVDHRRILSAAERISFLCYSVKCFTWWKNKFTWYITDCPAPEKVRVLIRLLFSHERIVLTIFDIRIVIEARYIESAAMSKAKKSLGQLRQRAYF